MTNSEYAIGIDLGTTTTCLAVWYHDRVEIIANDQGDRTTPSYVAFTNERLVGNAAKNQIAQNPSNTIFDAKRLIGRKYGDVSVQSDLAYLPYRIKPDSSNRPVISVTYAGQEKTFLPEEISAMVLAKVKEYAEGYLGRPVTKAVITVPAYFNDAQRQSTRDAGTIAGLEVIRILNEPTAAALAYGFTRQTEQSKNVLVFDCGGGTTDVTVLSMYNDVYEVKATHGDTHLGGEDFDHRLAKYFVDEFRKKHRHDLTTSPRAMRRLYTACEKVKKALSVCVQTTLEIDSLYEGIDFFSTISRAKLEELCLDLFRKTLESVTHCLTDAKLTKSQIDEIVSVGGSTRIPKIGQLLTEYFGGKALNRNIHPDEAVAYGAAIQAAMLTDQDISGKTNGLVLIDVTPLSLGLETAGGVMTPIIKRGTQLPCEQKETFSTFLDNQPGVDIKVFEGERKLTRDNHLLGNFRLNDISPSPKGVPQIEVTFMVNSNGILQVTATEESTGHSESITITNDSGHLSKAEIMRMVREAEEFAQSDLSLKNKIDAKLTLEQTVININSQSVNLSGQMQKLVEECQMLLNRDDANLTEYQTKYQELTDSLGSCQINHLSDK